MKRRKAYMPAGHLGTKRMGELAEIAFMYRAASEGIGVARPYGDSHPYDFLVQHGRRLARVQVKSCFTTQRGYRRMGFAIIVAKHARKGVTLYSPDEIDFIAAFVAPHRAWYVIPVEALKGSKSIRRDGELICRVSTQILQFSFNHPCRPPWEKNSAIATLLGKHAGCTIPSAASQMSAEAPAL